jgi:hypothetical protein
MVREAIQSAVPARRKKTERPHLKMASAALFVEAILESDRKAPRKQRHTARRIYDRIRAEIPGCTAAERTVRQYVEQRKHALGLSHQETFVPQSYAWGIEAQADWYEAYAELGGERIKLQVFFDAIDGQRCCVSSRLSEGHAAGVSGSAPVSVSLFRRRLPSVSLR